MTLFNHLKNIQHLDKNAMLMAENRWDSIAKPLHGLGLLEDAVVKIAGISGSAQVDISKKVVLVLCADNGVVAQGVSQCGQEVTAIVAENMANGKTSVCHMANIAGAEVIPVDIGCSVAVTGAISHAVRRGTGDITQEIAMTLEETELAILTGISLVKQEKQRGTGLIATGEMGIGNTTTSTAVLSVLLDKNSSLLTGAGAGLSADGIAKKKEIIAQSIAFHQPNPSNIVELLSKVGGLDLAGLTGIFLGGAIYRIPILIDGLISATAALCASKLAPNTQDFMLASHQSKELASKFALEALELSPLLFGELALGEGTGAVAIMPLLDMAVSVYENMSDFQDIGVKPYEKQV